jgi:hypothetical protein
MSLQILAGMNTDNVCSGKNMTYEGIDCFEFSVFDSVSIMDTVARVYS